MTERTAVKGLLDADWRRALASNMLRWFKHNARDLPWRRTRDLYAIWVSEIMLQQTQVATVISYYERFVRRFPDIIALATADENDVLRVWEGLGYYRRARQLHAAARRIVADHGGRFPATFDAARALPGIGRYTAGAILSIGLDQKLPILEANTIRVLSRLTAFREETSSSKGQKHLWAIAESIVPALDCGAFNQALMELGSEICTTRSPLCDQCPVTALCEAHRRNVVGKIPLANKPTKYENVTEIAVIVRNRGKVLLRHCQAGERWAGLWDFPRFALGRRNDSSALEKQLAVHMRCYFDAPLKIKAHVATLKHGVTRFRITLHTYEATVPARDARRAAGLTASTARWVSVNSLKNYPLSVTGRKISRLLAATVSPRNCPTSAPRR